MGLELCAFSNLEGDDYPVTAEEFIAEASFNGRDPFSPEGFQRAIDSLKGVGAIRSVIATEPLSQVLASELIRDDVGVQDSLFVINYFIERAENFISQKYLYTNYRGRAAAANCPSRKFIT